MDRDILLSPSQAIRLMALCAMLQDGSLSFRGDEIDDERSATDALKDAGEEIALQFGGAHHA